MQQDFSGCSYKSEPCSGLQFMQIYSHKCETNSSPSLINISLFQYLKHFISW